MPSTAVTRNSTQRRRASAGRAPIHSVVKTIDVIRLLSLRQVISVQQLSLQTKIPKPSIMRIIGTLVECGLVKQVSRRAGYCLTSKVLELSAGYHGLPAVIEVGAPYADALTSDLRWPAAIATLDVDAMVVRYSTIPISPYAHVSSTMNKRLSLVERAHGRAYLAFCTRAQRDALLNIFDASDRNRSGSGMDRGRLLQILNATRRAGYAKRALELEPQTSTIAVPILVGDMVRATIGITFFSRAVDKKSEAALARRLIDTAAAIGDALQVRTGRPATTKSGS
ncbi:MAG TPA: DNA-binding transcriptional regulator [Xanthobacteraceae bacterium]|jgi:IclR family mhp operon transcriptional activator